MAMVIVALGANLPSRLYGEPAQTLGQVVARLADCSLAVRRCSRWYVSPPWPPSGQPWYVNGVVLCESVASPERILTDLHRLEAELGRQRLHPNQARALDLDLIDYGGRVALAGSWPLLPHPRLADRAFVLHPLADVAPDWRDPRDGRSLDQLLADLDPASICMPL
ncbi:MAG: 2-amino-4-hydroxy-6-hydroxymethyldihydropteridine diphosphokinase [Pseudomonadota bacterium]